MSIESKYSVVITTTSSEELADELAKKILGAKLAACVQLQKIKSHYIWKGEISSDTEVLLLIKTRTDLFVDLRTFIQKNHTYETPEIIELPVIDGSSGYLKWIDEVTSA